MAITRHGHHIPGTIYTRMEKLAVKYRCGGPSLCSQCIQDVSNHRENTATEMVPKNEGLPDREIFNDGTMATVFNALVESGLTRDQALDGMSSMQKTGILFREQLPDYVGDICNDPLCRATYEHAHSFACNDTCSICHAKYDMSMTH